MSFVFSFASFCDSFGAVYPHYCVSRNFEPSGAQRTRATPFDGGRPSTTTDGADGAKGGTSTAFLRAYNVACRTHTYSSSCRSPLCNTWAAGSLAMA